MELNEHIVISFLLVVIVILIFSKISISTGKVSGDSSNSSDSSMETPKPTQKIPIMQPTVSTPYNPMNDSLLTDDFKKQLRALDNQFYTNVCRAT
jgi:hypothetical protein